MDLGHACLGWMQELIDCDFPRLFYSQKGSSVELLFYGLRFNYLSWFSLAFLYPVCALLLLLLLALAPSPYSSRVICTFLKRNNNKPRPILWLLCFLTRACVSSLSVRYERSGPLLLALLFRIYMQFWKSAPCDVEKGTDSALCNFHTYLQSQGFTLLSSYFIICSIISFEYKIVSFTLASKAEYLGQGHTARWRTVCIPCADKKNTDANLAELILIHAH